MSRLMTDNEEYSKLLASIKNTNSGFRRVLSPIQVANSLHKLISEEGIAVVENLLPLTRGNIKSFTRLLNLPEKCHNAIIWGHSMDHGVGFSAASHISTLNNTQDQLLLFSEATKLNLSEVDIQQIISFYKKNKLPLGEVIYKITNARPQTLTTYLIVVSISDISKKKLDQDSKMLKIQPLELLVQRFKDKFQIYNIDDIQLKGHNIVIGLKELEYKKYKKQILYMKLEYDEITEYIVN